MAARLELILGGARSGKSRQGELRAIASGLRKTYIATAMASGDEEMAERIRHHRKRREKCPDDAPWTLVEEPVRLADALRSAHGEDACILVDCLTLWISNCQHRRCWESERGKLLSTLPSLTGRVIFVSNEVGMGVIPLGKVAREFVDASGWLHQELSEFCQRVTLTVSGLSVELKNEQ